MTIRVPCACGKASVYPDAYEGRTLACRACGGSIVVAGEKLQPPRAPLWRRMLPYTLILIIPAVVLVVVVRAQQPRFVSAAEEYQGGSKASVDPAVDGPRIERLFASLAAASKEGNESAFASCFHERRMLAEIELRGGLSAVTRKRDEEELEGEVRATMKDFCEGMRNSLSAWQSVARCTWKFLEGRGEAEARVVMKSSDHLSRLRFWLLKENNAWAIYDYESLDTGFRMSKSNAKLLVRQAKREFSGRDLDRVSGLVDKARNLMVRDKLDESTAVLREAEVHAGSSAFQAEILVLQAELLFRQQNFEPALGKIDEALALEKDTPCSIEFRGRILHGLKRYPECIAAQEQYMKAVGDDPAAWLWIGLCYEALGNRAEAMAAYRKGMAADDSDVENRRRLEQLQKSGQ